MMEGQCFRIAVYPPTSETGNGKYCRSYLNKTMGVRLKYCIPVRNIMYYLGAAIKSTDKNADVAAETYTEQTPLQAFVIFYLFGHKSNHSRFKRQIHSQTLGRSTFPQGRPVYTACM